MIVYLDTSALVKLYIAEAGSDIVEDFVRRSDAAAISAVGYPECRSAFARAVRTGSHDVTQHQTIRRRFEVDWEQFVVLPADGKTLRLAGELVDQHILRGFDAVHLASAMVLRATRSTIPLLFVTWDQRLFEAARAENFVVDGG